MNSCAEVCETSETCDGVDVCQDATSDGSARVCWPESDPLPFGCLYDCLSCVGVERALTGDPVQDLAGTWVYDQVTIDTLPHLIVVDGTDVSSGGHEGLAPRGALEVDGDEVVVPGHGTVWRITPTSVTFQTPEGRYSPSTWLRVECTGGPFDDTAQVTETRCDDKSGDYCAEQLGDWYAACIESDEYWGHVAQCGYPAGTDQPTLHVYREVPNARDFAAFFESECVIDEAGSMDCTGRNVEDVPAGVFERVSVSETDACAVDEAGEVVCWGETDALQAAPSGPFIDVEVGVRDVCATRVDESLECWGTTDVSAQVPSQGFESVRVGDGLACGVVVHDSVVCWGKQVTTPSSLSSVAVYDGYACGGGGDGVKCWGNVPEFLQVDFDSHIESLDVFDMAVAMIDGASHVIPSGGANHFAPTREEFTEVQAADRGRLCGRRVDGTVLCWGPFIAEGL